MTRKLVKCHRFREKANNLRDGFVSPAFDDYFATASGHAPFDYQRVLAGSDDGTPCESHLVNIPTGLGKTAAIILAWLWNRIKLKRGDWPRRLVYCLPMRTLVEQTADNAKAWLKALHLSEGVGLHVLMGGEDAGDWDVYPEREAILIGTQDVLLSRALNRGYGMSRYRWPMHFGLLNNDCLWVLDEIQLMGPGLSTACQLEAFRLQAEPGSVERFGSYPKGRPVTWYASATANREHLQTRDWRDAPRPSSFFVELSPNEKAGRTGTIAERWLATKRVELHPEWDFGDRKNAPSSDLMDAIVEKHKGMIGDLTRAGAPPEAPRRTLVMCNTVGRAIAVYNGIKAKLQASGEIDLLLMHSRFRSAERESQVDRLANSASKPGGQIVVATQVIEAGVDVSSVILWTEIAPLACLVQRFGRLNRKGEFGYVGQATYGFAPLAIVIGIEAPDPASRTKKEEQEKAQREAERKFLPYDKSKCDGAWKSLQALRNDASPSALENIGTHTAASIDCSPYSLQRHELLDFFDTDANLSLGFTDVSPFVRGLDPETDIYVAWREWPGSDDGDMPRFSPDFQRQELCPIPISKANESRALLSKGWLWRGKESGWVSVGAVDMVPGMTILLPATAGGYRTEPGWTGSENDKPVANVYTPSYMPSDEELLSALDHGWRSIEQHTKDVESEWKHIINALNDVGLSDQEQNHILRAIKWHDVGKNHAKWQDAAKKALEQAGISVRSEFSPLAKFSLSDSPRLKELNDDGTPKFTGYALKKEIRALRESFRPGITHEVASALGFRQSEDARNRPIESLLAEYLVMSHHGRVRKVLRDEIPKQPRNPKDEETVRGVSDGDVLPAVMIAGQSLGCAALSTDCRRMGRDRNGHESYTRGVLRLLDHYGPFRLAFFEALFRAADIRASIWAQ
jgi:CRISPR-associated endonuclease/helicase Cas3